MFDKSNCINIPTGDKEANFIYKKTNSRNLELTFLPPTKIKYDKAPVYFLIPGGGWHVESKQSMIDSAILSIEVLREQGFAVVSIDYRVYKDGVVMREIIADCFDAARYVAHFANELKIDKDSFVVSGHSAGAHLALMLAYAPSEEFKDNYAFNDKFKVKAAAVMSPPTMLNDPSTYNLSDLDDLFIGEKDGEKQRTSPIAYVTSHCPPTLLSAGTCDYLVFATSAEKLYQKLLNCGIESKLLLSQGAGHCFEKIYDSIEPSITLEGVQKEIARFVLAHM